MTLEGEQSRKLRIITAYRVCSESIRTAPFGSAIAREYTYLNQYPSTSSANPSRAFLNDLQTAIQTLQNSDHMILLMLDANATLSSDLHLSHFIHSCMLLFLHAEAPAPSTFIGSDSRRIDYVVGCHAVQEAMSRSGTLSYTEGPQSDQRGLLAI